MSITIIFSIVFLWLWAMLQAGPKLLVSVPVANVLAEPTQDYKGKAAPIIHANVLKNLTTQVLYNEAVELQKEENGWMQVKLLEQAENISDAPSYVTGWLAASTVVAVDQLPAYNLVIINHLSPLYTQPNANSKTLAMLSMGTKFEGRRVAYQWWEVGLPNGTKGFLKDGHVFYFDKEIEDEHALRVMLVRAARKMKGDPFCWFGRSAYNPKDKHQLTSVGCDGLVDLVYRCCGLLLPRFAQHQYEQGVAINGDQLKPGDLIFYATKHGKAHHAMMYMGNDELLESTFQSESPNYPVRSISASTRLRAPTQLIKDQETFFGRYRVCFCSYVASLSKLKRMRNAARTSW